MSLMSMTGYGQAESIGKLYELSIEIKSVNHRFRDLRFKMGAVFNSLEMDARKAVEKEFARGSFDIYVNYKKTQQESTNTNIDQIKVKSFLEQAKILCLESGSHLQVDASLFLKQDFVKADDNKESELKELFLPTFKMAISNLKSRRVEEGEYTQRAFVEIINNYQELFNLIVKSKEKFQPILKEKLSKRITEAKESLEELEPRMLQEIIFYMEKWDLDEEIVRVNSHIKSLNDLINSAENNIVGRKIEFLLQELGRETNTIGSKSHIQEISQHVVDMKVQLEKMREQAANVQ